MAGMKLFGASGDHARRGYEGSTPSAARRLEVGPGSIPGCSTEDLTTGDTDR